MDPLWILYAVNRQGQVCQNGSVGPGVTRVELPKAVWFSAAVKCLPPKGRQHILWSRAASYQKSSQMLVLLCKKSPVKALHQAVGDLDLSLPLFPGIYSLGARLRAAQSPAG